MFGNFTKKKFKFTFLQKKPFLKIIKIFSLQKQRFCPKKVWLKKNDLFRKIHISSQ